MENKDKTNKPDTIKGRVKRDKEEFLQLFRESAGIVTITCQKKGMARCTFYDWYNNDPEFKKEADKIKREQIGMVEDRLLKAILENNITAIIFYLKCKHPEYKPKSELSFDKETVDKSLDKIKSILE